MGFRFSNDLYTNVDERRQSNRQIIYIRDIHLLYHLVSRSDREKMPCIDMIYMLVYLLVDLLVY